MSGKNNKVKQNARTVERANPIHWEQSWIEQVVPSIQAFANQSVRLRFQREVDVADRDNWLYGSDVDVLHDKRRILVTEWFVPVVDGKPKIYMDDGSLEPSMVARKFILRYDHLQQAARVSGQNGLPPNIGRYYLPEVTIVKGDKGWEAKFEENNLRGQEIILKALDRLEDYKRDLEHEHGKENNDGKYIGLALVYNKDENLLQLVTHTKHPLDVIEHKDGEMNYIDMPDIEIDGLALDEWDTHALNIRSAVERHAAENRGWVRVVKPSQDAYKRFSGDLADYIMSVVEEVYKRAHEGLPAGAVVTLDQAPETGLLKATYVDPNETAQVETQEGTDTLVVTPAVHDIELSREDAAAVLMVAGRIEPDMWFHVDYDVKLRFNAQYGNGKVTILEAVV